MIYLAKVDSALTTTVTGLKWFKIWEDGLDSNGTWAVTRLYNNKGKVEFTLPKCIQNGNYLLRAEIIALHAASSYPGAQLYMECAQINVLVEAVLRRRRSAFQAPTRGRILVSSSSCTGLYRRAT
jgi:hypothetical protein